MNIIPICELYIAVVCPKRSYICYLYFVLSITAFYSAEKYRKE